MRPNFARLQQAIGLLLLCFSLTVQAQMKVGQPAGPPDPSTALDVSGGPYNTGSPYRGIAPPKVALTQTSSSAPIIYPVTGLLIYNTAKIRDVTPGYYYWEGKRWTRFSTATNAGAARLSAVGGQFIPAYLISQVISLSTPDIIYIADEGREGMFRFDSASTTSADGAMTLTASGGRYKRIWDGYSVNVTWFGAKGDNSAGANVGIQAAIDFAKSQLTGNGVSKLIEVLFPPGNYQINTTINVTNIFGITLRGASKYSGVVFNGNSGNGKPIFDCSGMTAGKLIGLSFTTDTNYVHYSTIGVQFALTSTSSYSVDIGGLNNSITECYFAMPDMPGANGGFGSIAILNMAAEEFSLTNSLIKANCGGIFSCNKDLSATGHTYTITSDFTNIAQGNRSMSATNIANNVSVINVQKRSPAFIFNSCAAVNVQVYIARLATFNGGTPSLGNEERALAFYGQNDNINVFGNVEAFPTVAGIYGASNRIKINMVASNQGGSTLPVFDCTGFTSADNWDLSVDFTTIADYNNGRTILYHAPVNGGDSPTGGGINTLKLACPRLIDNGFAISANLLKNVSYGVFETGQAFEKRNGSLIDLKHYKVPFGNLSAGTNQQAAGNVIRFYRADKTTTTSGNGGVYVAKVRGTIQIGDYSSANRTMVEIEGTTSIVQAADGTLGSASSQVLILRNYSSNTSYVTVNDIILTMEVNGGIINVRVYVKTTGSGSSDPVTFLGKCEVISDFAVNQAIIIA